MKIKGVDLNTVRELLCHSDMKMTMRYAHLAPESKLKAVELLDTEKQLNQQIDFRHLRNFFTSGLLLRIINA